MSSLASEQALDVQPPEWQIPHYDRELWRNRAKSYCLIVPVINEGQRLHDLLKCMRKKNISDSVDVIIVDGGSSDGSLVDIEKHLPALRGLLRLKKPEGLSAQLRCAYAFALMDGYAGVITIDGNNKDDPEAVPRFVEMLAQGYDFIQGSRFIQGGIRQNTPLLRYFAIRCIHAPLLSLCSRFKWTDTTQGFRAYSRKLLLDNKVQPFRNVFVRYELLAYLSVRAPQVNLRCAEVRTCRRYPLNQKAPTKISKFRGNWLVFKTLIMACAGRYNPVFQRQPVTRK